LRKSLAAISVVFLAAHLAFLPPTLEDIDSVNFALGVADFDVSKHQPHPPGYPVFIGLSKASTSLLRSAHVRNPEVRGLAVWSAISGAALAFALFALFQALVGVRPGSTSRWMPFCATLVVLMSPLFWFTALRPLSDMTGLAMAIAAQALIVAVLTGLSGPSTLIWGGLLCGLAIGVRSQTALLTLPPLVLALLLPRSGLRPQNRFAAVGAAALGVLVWAVPLVVASGGLSEYARALGSQAGEDFSGVVMLWTTRTKAAALDAAMYSFLWPWGHPIAGGIVVIVALAGAIRALWALPRALGLLLVAYVPYAVFHLLFQETITVRYALPLVVPVAFLAMCGLDWGRGTGVVLGATALVAWSTALWVPATAAYGSRSCPAFRALIEAARPGVGSANQARVVGLHAVARRAVDWLQLTGSVNGEGEQFAPRRVLRAPHGQEWLTLVEQWRAEPSSQIMFVADPRRTDLALIDGASRRQPLQFQWGFLEPPFVGGTRPGDSDLYALAPPGWMLDRGWAVTAEVAGVTARDGFGPHRKPSVAWIRGRDDEATLLVGGRHLGGASDPPVRITLLLNGAPLDSIDVKPGFFFRRLSLARGSLAGAGYIPLAISSSAADGSNRVMAVGLEQFDLQGAGMPMIGAEEGWYEPEYNPRTARSWRWTAEKAALWVRPVGRNVMLTLSGESPLKYYDAAPNVVVAVGDREVARFSPSADFTQEIVLPADALASADGRVVITCDRFFVPAQREGSPDQRHLALRMYSYSVR
jgi:transmembrane protein TMEM260 (protein O-mannosyltransferase)